MNSEDIRRSNDLLTIARGYGLTFRKNGTSYISKCPFHEEKTASLSIKGDRFTCFGCGEKGSVIDFVAKMENITIAEAMRKLNGGEDLHISKAKKKPMENKDICHIAVDYVSRSRDDNSVLFKFLTSIFDYDKVRHIFGLYMVGMTRERETIFWQVDQQLRVRSGKIMRYQMDGHRDKTKDKDKNNSNKTNWVHSKLKQRGLLSDEWELTQCLFGEHLLGVNTNIVAIVESEKTALVGSIVMDKFTFVATGGHQGFNERKLLPLKGYTCVAFPDEDKKTEWKEIADELNKRGFNIRISDSDYFTGEKSDLADYIIAKKTALNAKYEMVKRLGGQIDLTDMDILSYM